MLATDQRSSADTGAGLKELSLTEILNAPRRLTWQSWTEASQVAQWWGPHEFSNPVCLWDARPGGLIHIDMRAPDGRIFPVRGVFHDVRALEWLDFTTTASAEVPGGDQLQVRHHVSFEGHDGRTRLTLQSRVVKTTAATAPAFAGMEEGWKQSFDRLAQLLAKM
jgi:uncharacterized protein YndB with AHSA1/START domain